jgi:hypothetical protein
MGTVSGGRARCARLTERVRSYPQPTTLWCDERIDQRWQHPLVPPRANWNRQMQVKPLRARLEAD